MRRFHTVEIAAIAGGVAALLVAFVAVSAQAQRERNAERRAELVRRAAEMFADYNVLRGLIGLPVLSIAQAVEEYAESTARSGRG